MDTIVIIMVIIAVVAGVAGFVMEHGTGAKDDTKEETTDKK